MRYLIVQLMVFVFWPLAVLAQEIRDHPVQFAPGTDSASVAGQITGYEIRDYLVRAHDTQVMQVRLQVDNRFAYFNVLSESGKEVLHVGSLSGNHFAGVVACRATNKVRIQRQSG